MNPNILQQRPEDLVGRNTAFLQKNLENELLLINQKSTNILLNQDSSQKTQSQATRNDSKDTLLLQDGVVAASIPQKKNALSKFNSKGQKEEQPSNQHENKHQIHLGILYSFPLVAKVKKTNKEYTAQLDSDPVDFATECNRILVSFQGQKKSVNCHIECATIF